MDELSSRFLDAFNAVEDWLRQQLQVPHGTDFHVLVDEMSANHHGVYRHGALLKKFSKLRNLVVHEYSRDRSMTVPTTYTVERILAVRDELLCPPTLYSISARPVAMCCSSDPVGFAVKKMHDGSYSQLPVYDDGLFIGLLTAETVARWLASNLSDGQELVEEKPIAVVLKHQEDPENHTFLARVSSVLDGLAAFDGFMRRGKRLEAILLTENGRPTEQPLGLVTVHDIPKMRRAIRE